MCVCWGCQGYTALHYVAEKGLTGHCEALLPRMAVAAIQLKNEVSMSVSSPSPPLHAHPLLSIRGVPALCFGMILFYYILFGPF